ncbi:MAG: magnesium transporter [Candidatus Dependentiae bacterium]|nr:magnesium transporter [Candidatus Dependentiae bacterium]
MERQKLFEELIEHIDDVIGRKSEVGMALRVRLESLHPADIAIFLSMVDEDESRRLFLSFSAELKMEVFKELSDAKKALYISFLEDRELRYILMHLSVDELTDFFDLLTDEQLEQYLRLLQKKERDQVVSVLQLAPDSIGRHMDVDVLTLISDFTVEKSIQLLQRIQPDQELHRRIFVTSREGILEGHILLEDLVLKKPAIRLSAMVRPNEFVARVDEDREAIARMMVHYNVMTAPIVNEDGKFLGIVPANELIDIIEEESSEDIYRMATMSPIKDSYFDTSFFTLLWQRSSVLIVLLFAQTLSTAIASHYAAIMSGFLWFFTTMLISTGGNTSSQTSALAIKGLATGEIDQQSFWRFIRREFIMSLSIGLVLGVFSFVRIYIWHPLNVPDIGLKAFAVSASLFAIVVISMMLGSCIPLALRRFNVDPAHSAGPLLTTLMDIIGLFVYCVIASWILS